MPHVLHAQSMTASGSQDMARSAASLCRRSPPSTSTSATTASWPFLRRYFTSAVPIIPAPPATSTLMPAP